MRLPSPAFAVSVLALVVSLGGTSYAVSTIGSKDIKKEAVRSKHIKDDTIRSKDVKDGTLRPKDFRGGALPVGPAGPQGEPGIGRWVLIDANGEIEAQSGGFEVAAGYPEAPAAANGNVYINAGEDLSNNGMVAVIALQNQVDQNADGIMNGRADAPDANPEFAGEISATMCGIPGVVGCAPTGTNNSNHFVVSPRMSDGRVTDDDTRKRFYVIITGDSTDLVAP